MGTKLATKTKNSSMPPSVAMHPEAEVIVSQLASGVPPLMIAEKFSLSAATAYRAARHLQQLEQDEADAEVSLTLAGVASRILEISNSARRTRRHAEEVGQHRLALEAGAGERASLRDLQAIISTVAAAGVSLDYAGDAQAVAGALAALARADGGQQLVTDLVPALKRYGASDALIAAVHNLRKKSHEE